MVRDGEPGQFAAVPLSAVLPPRRPAHQHLSTAPASSILPMALRCSAPASNFSAWRPGQQHPRYATPAISISATPPWPQHLIYGAPASNKPHLAEKSTPVWLAIWRTWAGFANSQHRDAAFATPDNICAHLLCCNIELLLRQTQIFRPICTDCLRHLRISAK